MVRYAKFVTEVKFFALDELMSKNRLKTHVSGTALASVGDQLLLTVFCNISHWLGTKNEHFLTNDWNKKNHFFHHQPAYQSTILSNE